MSKAEKSSIKPNKSTKKETPASFEETLDTLRASDEYPSDEDIQEAEKLKDDLTNKHKERKKALNSQFQSQSREDLRGELEDAKSRTRAKLAQNKADVENKKDDGAGDQAEGLEDIVDETITAPKRRNKKEMAAKMREKMLQAKEAKLLKADSQSLLGESCGDATDSTHQLRGQRRGTMTTRFDDSQGQAGTLRPTHGKPAKEITWEELKEKQGISDAEAYDFFTRDWGPGEKSIPEITEAVTREKDPNEDVEAGLARDVDPLLGVDGKYFKSEADYVTYRKVNLVNEEEQLDKEHEMLYVPAVVENPNTIEVPPRFIEEEGLYVGRPQPIARSNLLRLENRLVKEGKLEWFAEDGKIKLQPDPLKEIPYRPVLWDDQNNPQPEHLKTVFVPPLRVDTGDQDNGGLLKSIDDGTDEIYQLEVDIHSLVFAHHHLMSEEHVIAQHLRHLYDNYRVLVEKDLVSYCQQRIDAMKRGILIVEEQMMAAKSNVDSDSTVQSLQERITLYHSEIKNFRALRNREECHVRELLANILQTWKRLKEERQKNGFINTNLQLKIHKKDSDQRADEQLIRKEVDEELEETRALAEDIYRTEYAKYEELLKEYETQKQRKTDAQRRQKRRELKARRKSKDRRASRDQAEEEDEDLLLMNEQDFKRKQREQDEEQEDMRVLAEDDLECPEAPQPFNTEAERQKIRMEALKNRRQPGEPFIWVTLRESIAITAEQLCPRQEQDRRKDMLKYSYFIKIFFNNKEVGSTDLRNLSDDFEVYFGMIFPIQIVQYPQQIKLQIFEKKTFSKTMLGEIRIGAPSSQATRARVQVEPKNFVSQQNLVHKHSGVGSGVQFTFLPSNDSSVGATIQPTELSGNDTTTAAKTAPVQKVFTGGFIRIAAAWKEDEEGIAIAPPMNEPESVFMQYANYDALAAIGADDAGDMDKLSAWARKAQLDPNDPRYAYQLSLIEMNDNLTGGEAVIPRSFAGEYFRLDHLQEEFNLATEEEMNSNLRFKLLQLRNDEIPEFRFMQIPASEKEITTDVFKEYEDRMARKRKRKDEKLKGFELRKALRENYLDAIRTEVLSRFHKALKRKTLKEVVSEEEVPNIGSLIPSLLKLGEPRRPLQPTRTERKKVPILNIQQMSVELVVSISSAHNIPMRIVEDNKIVSPFVEVRFQDFVRRTEVGDGPNPSWNASLQLPFILPPNVQSLDAVSEDILITLYDEVVENLERDERQVGIQVQQRIERRYLGNLVIPFATVYNNVKVEGRFKLTSPPVLLGYERKKVDISTISDKIVTINSHQSLIDIFVTLEPAIQPPESLKERFDSNEDPVWVSHAEKWWLNVHRRFPKRIYKYVVVDMKCKEVFIMRYLRPLSPPDDVLQNAKDIDDQKLFMARFVSLIPFVSDTVVFSGMTDIWSTCDLFLNMLTGDEDEHAVLLASYFLKIYPENRVFLCMGLAIPEGPTTYVLTIENPETNHVRLWCSATGDCYSIRDSLCPLKTVDCLISSTNVWANIQVSNDPNSMRFDVSQIKEWSPLFTPKIPMPPMASIQPENLNYEASNPNEIVGFRLVLENTLREKFMSWRRGQLTKWNYEFMRELSQILQRLEENCGRPYKNIEEDYRNIQSRYTMYGFPINLPYMETEDIVERVQTTGIHMAQTKNVEFGLAVYVKGYSCGVLSIWIYVASLTPKNRR